VLPDQASGVRPDQVQPRCGAPVPEQPRLHVLGEERLAQQGVVKQVDLPDGEVVRRTPPRMQLLELLALERALDLGEWLGGWGDRGPRALDVVVRGRVAADRSYRGFRHASTLPPSDVRAEAAAWPFRDRFAYYARAAARTVAEELVHVGPGRNPVGQELMPAAFVGHGSPMNTLERNAPDVDHGSGNVVHNLRKVRPVMGGAGFDWAQRFDEDARALMRDAPTEIAALPGHADFGAAVPTPDHFIPLLYLAGLAGDASRAADVLVDGYAAGSLSMTAYTLDATYPPAAAGGGGAAALPADVDPEDINV
jgi:hypothetical protein